ncbi:MAG: hypothetical protein GX458_17575 [Phyllobacteriaceae bacterium]|nr:hypothetical protein [Phyllobacteriaceae bacterium]
MAAVLIPLGLAVLMRAVGLETRLDAFRALAGAPAAVALGLLAQLVGLPLLAALLAESFALPTPHAVGLVLLAAAPGGVTANFVTLMARGDVALAVTLTVVTSLAAPLTVPFWVGFAFDRFADENVAVVLPFAPTLGAVFATTVLPLLIGVVLADRRPAFAARSRPWTRRISTVVFVVVVAAAVAAQGSALVHDGLTVGPATLALDLAALAVVIGLSGLLGVSSARRAALIQTTGLRNVAVALTVAVTLLGRPDVAVAATVYVAVMNAVALLHVAWRRAHLSEVKDDAV